MSLRFCAKVAERLEPACASLLPAPAAAGGVAFSAVTFSAMMAVAVGAGDVTTVAFSVVAFSAGLKGTGVGGGSGVTEDVGGGRMGVGVGVGFVEGGADGTAGMLLILGSSTEGVAGAELGRAPEEARAASYLASRASA